MEHLLLETHFDEILLTFHYKLYTSHIFTSFVFCFFVVALKQDITLLQLQIVRSLKSFKINFTEELNLFKIENVCKVEYYV